MLHLTAEHLAEMVAQARAEAPREVCGLLAGREGQVARVYPLRNIAAEPTTRYLADPQELLHAFQEMEERDWEILAIYHSHPCLPAYPSPTDLAMAYYPDALHVILSLAEPSSPHVRAFRLVERQVTEEEIAITK